jgi:hypothetical protein
VLEKRNQFQSNLRVVSLGIVQIGISNFVAYNRIYTCMMPDAERAVCTHTVSSIPFPVTNTALSTQSVKP